MIFSDNSRANSEIRIYNVETLTKKGFEGSGVYSTSGTMQIVEHKNKTSIVFGVRSNIAGKGRTKYFTLKKDFASKEIAEKTFFILTKILKSK